LARILIRTASIVSVDPNVGDLQRGNVLVDGGKIAAISGSIAAEDAEIMDPSNQIANPGFIDIHRYAEDERPLAIHGVQRVFHAPLRLQGWVGASKTTLVVIGDVGTGSAIEDTAQAICNSAVEESRSMLERAA
jgi:N-acyl-D-aspartate/D-glutamate deacylase